MKKFLLMLVALASFGVSGLYALEPGADNGFGLRLGLGMPNKFYGMPEEWKSGDIYTDNKADELYRVRLTYGLVMDTRWYVWHNNSFGVAINARWLDGSWGITHKTLNNYDMGYSDGTLVDVETKTWVTEAGLFGPGLIFTWYPGSDLAIDVQYNFLPEAIITSYDWKAKRRTTMSDMYFGWGFAHVFGASFRWKALHIGFEQKIAYPKYAEIMKDNTFNNLNNIGIVANKSRIFIGIKLCK